MPLNKVHLVRNDVCVRQDRICSSVSGQLYEDDRSMDRFWSSGNERCISLQMIFIFIYIFFFIQKAILTTHHTLFIMLLCSSCCLFLPIEFDRIYDVSLGKCYSMVFVIVLCTHIFHYCDFFSLLYMLCIPITQSKM